MFYLMAKCRLMEELSRVSDERPNFSGAKLMSFC